MKLSGAEITIKMLERQGITIIAGIPGGANLPLYDALYKSNIRHILTRHEQGAGFIAQGMARSNGRATVCFATSGPGATNLITAIADAMLDSIPIIAITGQVTSSMIGTDAFQEVDMYGLTLPITKHSYIVRTAKDLLSIIPEAFMIAESGRPGPVVIDIPKDVQLEKIEIEEWPKQKYDCQYNGNTKYENSDELNLSQIEKVAELINKSHKPLLYVGGGVINSNAHEYVNDLAHKNSIPVTLTLMGLGCFSPDDSLYLGMIGMHGARYTNYIVNEADLIIALGVRFDDRATGNVIKFCPNANIIHIDIDPAEIDKLKKSHISIVGDIGKKLEKINSVVNENKREEWISHIKQLKAAYPLNNVDRKDIFHPVNLIKNVSELVEKDTIITTDVGQHQMWVAQTYPVRSPRTLLTSGGLGTMGFGLPAAIGAALANPEKCVVCMSGDGSILMNIQELATLADLDLNVTVIIFNNGHLGLVRQQQELFYNKNYIACKFKSSTNFPMISSGFGIKSYDLNETDDPLSVLKNALTEKGPCVVNVPINYSENVLPMIPPGGAIDEMLGD